MDNKLVKSNSGIISKVSNLISITNKIIDKDILIPYRKGNKWGFSSPDKKIVIDCIYTKVKSFKNKLAAVNFDEKWGFINEVGEKIIPFNYDAAFSFWENYAEVISNNIAFKITSINSQNLLIYSCVILLIALSFLLPTNNPITTIDNAPDK